MGQNRSTINGFLSHATPHCFHTTTNAAVGPHGNVVVFPQHWWVAMRPFDNVGDDPTNEWIVDILVQQGGLQ